MRVALLSCACLPEPDPDEVPLLRALQGAGASARSLAWDAPDEPLERFDALVLRATWNYHLHPQRFLAFIERAQHASRLINPASVVRATLHKRYLIQLAERGIPTVPTHLVPRGSEPTLPPGPDPIVIKPAISAGSWSTRRYAGDDPEALDFLTTTSAARDMLVQPVLEGFEDPGERSLVWIDGAFSHAIRKAPRFEGQPEQIVPLTTVNDGDQQLAREALATLGDDLCFARVDLVDQGDQAVVTELECIEPSLFLDTHPPSAAALVDAILRRIPGAAP